MHLAVYQQMVPVDYGLYGSTVYVAAVNKALRGCNQQPICDTKTRHAVLLALPNI